MLRPQPRIIKSCAINSRTTQRFLDALPDSLRLPKDVRVQKSVKHLTEELNITSRNTLDAVTPLKPKNICHKKISSLVYRKQPSPEASFQKIGMEMAFHQTGSLPTSLEKHCRAISKSPPCCLVILLQENKNNPKCIFDSVAKLTKKQHSLREDGFHFSSDEFVTICHIHKVSRC